MFRKFIRSFLRIGLDRTQDRLEYQRVLLVNTLTLVIQGFILVLIGIVIGYQLWTHVLIGIGSFLLLKPTYYLNSIGKYNWAGLYMVNLCVLGILAASYVAFFESRFSETENWLYAFIAISVFLFDGGLMRFHFWLITIEVLLAKVVKFYVLNIPMGQDFVLLLVNSIILSLGLYVFLLIFKFGLRRSLKKLEEADRTKNKLFSIVAHDLKSPFTLFQSMLDASKAEDITPDQFIKMRDGLTEKFQPIRNTVTGLLDWSQIQLNNIQPVSTTFDPKKEICAVISSLSPVLTEKNQEVKISGELPQIKTDVNHFQIIIRNLLHNAIKYSPADGKINVQLSDNDTVGYITVSDCGDGMDPDKIRSVLRNQPVISSRGTKGEKGTGIGLNMSKELMDRNGIKLKIDSTIGAGSTFSLTVPK